MTIMMMMVLVSKQHKVTT